MSFTPGYSDALTKACCERMPMARFYLKNARFSGTGNYSTVTGLESMQNWRSMLSGGAGEKGYRERRRRAECCMNILPFFQLCFMAVFCMIFL
jgi:hypothetical protein